jgi:tetratricopeptide (TPR) repeat protein
VLEVQPENATALDALARLRASAGDAGRALEAIEALAIGAATPEAKAEQYLRAAKLLEDRGDLEGAIERYKRALDASPKDRKASAALRSALVRQGNAKAAVELLERELEDVEGEAVRGRLAGELAKLYNVHLHDDLRAEAAARRALRHDPANIDALTALGDLAFAAEHFLEAAKHYESVVGRTDALERDEALRVLRAFIDALTKSGSAERALAACDSLLRLAPDDLEIAMHVGDVVFEHGTARQAFELYWKLVHEFREDLAHSDRALALYRLGESARRGGDLESAVGRCKRAPRWTIRRRSLCAHWPRSTKPKSAGTRPSARCTRLSNVSRATSASSCCSGWATSRPPSCATRPTRPRTTSPRSAKARTTARS